MNQLTVHYLQHKIVAPAESARLGSLFDILEYIKNGVPSGSKIIMEAYVMQVVCEGKK